MAKADKSSGAAPKTEAEVTADAAREEAELQAMIDTENAEKAAAEKKAGVGAAAAAENEPEAGKPSTIDTLAKLGKTDESMTERSEAEIAADLQTRMAESLPQVAESVDDEVQVNVPKSFFLRLADQTLVSIRAGTKTLPRAHAEHPYSKDNGVTLSGDVPDRAYADAAAEIVRGEMELDYAVNGISRHFKASADQVRAELTARVEKLKGAQ